MDVLSEVLKVIKLEGAIFFNAEFSAPWCVNSSPHHAIAPFISLAAGHVIRYHFISEGRAYAQLLHGPRIELGPGDIVIFPHSDPHILGNGHWAKPANTYSTFEKNLTQGVKLMRFGGGGGETTRLVCGFMACDPGLSSVVLSGLPEILKINVADEPSGQWIENSIRYSVSTTDGPGEGRGLVLTKLSEVLFVETLRRYVNSLPPDQKGWLAGARDPVISEVLALLHKEPADPWTIANLARRVGLSRTRLAERFRHFLGESPMAYLAQWRLKLGANILQSTENSVAEVAAAVGYGSEAAFNRAFKREFKCPPAQFRRKYKTALAR
jgi:AraC-like DNA-binding protein